MQVLLMDRCRTMTCHFLFRSVPSQYNPEREVTVGCLNDLSLARVFFSAKQFVLPSDFVSKKQLFYLLMELQHWEIVVTDFLERDTEVK